MTQAQPCIQSQGVIKGGARTDAELAQQYEIHPSQITDWKRMLLGNPPVNHRSEK